MRDVAGAGPDVTLSAVITCYYEEKTIDEFHGKLIAALRDLSVPFEIIYVNDGSTDETFAHLRSIYERDSEVRAVVDLFRNAGQTAAIAAALEQASGSVVLSMDSDLQLDPAEIGKLWTEYERGNDVVSGFRAERADTLMRKIPSKIANVIMRRASRAKMTDFGCTFKLYNAKLIRAFDFGPHRPFNPVGVIARAGKCTEVPVSHAARKVGKSGWTFKKLWSYQMEHIVQLSERPFQFLAGLCLSLALLAVLRVLLAFAFDFSLLDTVTNGLLLNVLLGGVLLLLSVLAVMGEFVIRVFAMTQREPHYVVKTLIHRDHD